MKYLLDTANLDAIRYYTDIFPIAGVTSNPSIVKKEGKIDFFAHMNEIRSIIGMDKTPVSYTHLDVYKRQLTSSPLSDRISPIASTSLRLSSFSCLPL